MLIGNTRIGGIGSLSVKNTYDPDALAYLTAVEAADGQALENSVKIAINTFVVGCKTDGIWTAIKASCILAGARTLSGALVPLAGNAPTNANFVSGDYSRKTGLLGDGSSKYLNANRLNSADPKNSKHLSVYCTSGQSLDGSRVIIGNQNGTTNSLIFTTISQTLSLRINYSSPATAFNISGVLTGLIGASRYSASQVNAFYGGSLLAHDHNSAVVASSNAIYVFTNGITLTQYSNARISFYSIGESIDLSLLNSRITTLMTTLNALL